MRFKGDVKVVSGSHNGVQYGPTAKMVFEVDAANSARLTVITEEAPAVSIEIGPIAVERLSFLNRTELQFGGLACAA